MFGDIFEGEVEQQGKRFVFGGYEVDIMCVPGENQHIDKWVPLVVWHAAEAFAEEFTQNLSRMSDLRNKRIIELGSGTGLCGLLACKIAQESPLTLLTDESDDSLLAMESSITMNHLNVNCFARKLSWGDAEAMRSILDEFQSLFDVCLATDVIYDAVAVLPLLRSASSALKPGEGKFFLANHKFRLVGLHAEIDRCLLLGDEGAPLLQLVGVSHIADGKVDLYEFKRI